MTPDQGKHLWAASFGSNEVVVGRSIGLFSNKTITPKGVAAVMNHLRAEEDAPAWCLSREGRRVWVELASDELDGMPGDILREIYEELGDIPVSMIVVMFNDSQADRFEWRMARAVGMAMAEHYPIVWHDYANDAETLYAPGSRPVSDAERVKK